MTVVVEVRVVEVAVRSSCSSGSSTVCPQIRKNNVHVVSVQYMHNVDNPEINGRL